MFSFNPTNTGNKSTLGNLFLLQFYTTESIGTTLLYLFFFTNSIPLRYYISKRKKWRSSYIPLSIASTRVLFPENDMFTCVLTSLSKI